MQKNLLVLDQIFYEALKIRTRLSHWEASLVPEQRANAEALRAATGSVHLLRASRRVRLLGSLYVAYRGESREQDNGHGHTHQAPSNVPPPLP